MGYLVFALRVAIGGTLIVAGVLKAHDGAALTASAIAAYRLLPAFAIAPLGIALPYVEMLLGAYLASGFFVRVAAWAACVQFGVFSVAVGSLVVRNIPADCGCFGSSVATPPSWGHVALDVALAGACALIALRAPGALALDRTFGLAGLTSTGTGATGGTLEAQHEA